MRLQIRNCRLELSLLSQARRAQRDTFVRESCKNGVKRLIPRSTEVIIPG